MTSATRLLGGPTASSSDHTRTYESPSWKRWVAGGVGLTIAVSAIAFMILGCLQPDGFLRSVGTIGNPHSWALWTLVGGGLVIGGTLIAYAIVKRENHHNHAVSTRPEGTVPLAQGQEPVARQVPAPTYPAYYDHIDDKVTKKKIPLPSGGTLTMKTLEQPGIPFSPVVNSNQNETLREKQIEPTEAEALTTDDIYNGELVKIEDLNLSSPSAQQPLRLANNFEELLGDELLKKIPAYPDPMPEAENITGQEMPQRMLKCPGDGFSFIALKLKCVSSKETIETHVAKTRFIRTIRNEAEKHQLVQKLTSRCQTKTIAFLLVHYPQKGWRQFVPSQDQVEGCCLAPSFVFDDSRMLVTDKFNISFTETQLDELIEQGLVNLKDLMEQTSTTITDHNGLEWELASD